MGQYLQVRAFYFLTNYLDLKYQGVPEDTNQAYNEARTCFSVNSFTACKLLCRKILMHIAVDKGAQSGDKFEKYINYLENQGFVSPPMKDWVNLIRVNGNEATHGYT